MTKLGIIGGIGPEATVDYYLSIIKQYQQSMGNQQVLPEITIESINMYHMFALLQDKKYDQVVAYLKTAVDHLEAAGADFAIMCGNTPHIVFEQLQQQTNLPLMSMVETSVAEAQRLGLKRLGLLGTRFTMENDFFVAPFERAGIEIKIPNPDEINFIHEKIVSELENGIVKPETKKQLLAIAERMISANHLDGIILGCTELPLILKPEDFNVETFDITKIHIAAIVKELIK
ncbi:amino acid racemase [Fructilactobacillus vespulae]|uniref:aspartate/glutamate racemase family protein n=1 Tax=Fructilactobacillus vespulae TaxID=1249630 RepID=UPI0039B3C90D